MWFPSIFYWMKVVVCWFKYPWSVFMHDKISITLHCSRYRNGIVQATSRHLNDFRQEQHWRWESMSMNWSLVWLIRWTHSSVKTLYVIVVQCNCFSPVHSIIWTNAEILSVGLSGMSIGWIAINTKKSAFNIKCLHFMFTKCQSFCQALVRIFLSTRVGWGGWLAVGRYLQRNSLGVRL